MRKSYLILPFLLISQANWTADLTVFAHGIVDGPSQMHRFTDAMGTSNNIALEFPDACKATDWGLNGWISTISSSLSSKIVNRNAMHMGQGPDIEAIAKIVENIHQDQKIILYGCSRGSAAILNYLAEYNPVQVSALVLDATPANIAETIQKPIAQLGINPTYATQIFTTIFPAYPDHAIPTVQVIKNIANKNLPILLIHSKTDQRVAYQNSLMLFEEFQRQGFTNVNLVVIPSGRHSFLLQDNVIRPIYLKAVHNFYKKYGLPYNPEWANSDDQYPLSPLTHDEIQQALQDYTLTVTQTYQHAYQRNAIIAGILAGLIAVKLMERYSSHQS